MNVLEKALGLLVILVILWIVMLVMNFASMVDPPLSLAEWWAKYRSYVDGEMKANLGFGLVVILTGVAIKVRRLAGAGAKPLKKDDDEI